MGIPALESAEHHCTFLHGNRQEPAILPGTSLGNLVSFGNPRMELFSAENRLLNTLHQWFRDSTCSTVLMALGKQSADGLSAAQVILNKETEANLQGFFFLPLV